MCAHTHHHSGALAAQGLHELLVLCGLDVTDEPVGQSTARAQAHWYAGTYPVYLGVTQAMCGEPCTKTNLPPCFILAASASVGGRILSTMSAP